jgi:hypothetical protein
LRKAPPRGGAHRDTGVLELERAADALLDELLVVAACAQGEHVAEQAVAEVGVPWPPAGRVPQPC